jgi:hypothetical protein
MGFALAPTTTGMPAKTSTAPSSTCPTICPSHESAEYRLTAAWRPRMRPQHKGCNVRPLPHCSQRGTQLQCKEGGADTWRLQPASRKTCRKAEIRCAL